MGAQVFDLLARRLGVVEASHGLGAVVDLLAQLGERLLQLAELVAEFFVRSLWLGRAAIGGSAFRRALSGRRRDRGHQQSRDDKRNRQQSRHSLRRKDRAHDFNQRKKEAYFARQLACDTRAEVRPRQPSRRAAQWI